MKLTSKTSKSIRAIMLVVALVGSLLTAIAAPTAANALALTLTSVGPSSGSTLGGNRISLTGTGFLTSNFYVYVGGSYCLNVQVSDSSHLTCETPAHDAGTVPVKVFIGFGPQSELASAFTYVAPTWTERTLAGTRNWSSVASSQDGTKLAATDIGGYIYTSADSGATWTAHTGPGTGAWYSIASSSNGEKLAAVMPDTRSLGEIWTSGDSGQNWTKQDNSGLGGFWSIASDATGSKLVAAKPAGAIYTSTDSGVNWTKRTTNNEIWYSVTSSSDGNNLAAVVANGGVYTSTNAGADWTLQTGAGTGNWHSIASSGDGTRLVAARNKGGIWTSSDYGVNWVERTNAGTSNWQSVATNGTGNLVVACATGGSIYVSTDYGVNWVEQTSAGSGAWNSVAWSGDGTKVVAVNTGGSIWTFGTAPAAPAPTITSVLQTSGPTVGGTAITITGTGFDSGATVTVGGSACTNVSVVSETSITCDTPAGLAGARDVVVTNSDTQAATATGAFTYVAPPTITSVSQTSGPTAGGTTITITGTDFVSGATVMIGDLACNSVNFVSSTSLTCVTPAGVAGGAGISVTNPDTQYTGGPQFTYVAPPTITSVSPNKGTIFGGLAITIAGTGFVSGATVTVGGSPCTNVTVTSVTSITCTTPSGVAGAANVSVRNPDTQTATANGAFIYTSPVFSASTPSIPNTQVGSSSAIQTETITNTGDGELVFYGATLLTGTNAGDFAIVSDTCAMQTVAPGGTCKVTYRFSPTATGVRTANLVFIAIGNLRGVTLSGTGTAPVVGAITIRKIEGASGSVKGGTTVEITGTGFNGGATVKIGGVTATILKRKGSTSITVRTPAHAAGKVLVVVTNPDTGSASYNGFTYKK